MRSALEKRSHGARATDVGFRGGFGAQGDRRNVAAGEDDAKRLTLRKEAKAEDMLPRRRIPRQEARLGRRRERCDLTSTRIEKEARGQGRMERQPSSLAGRREAQSRGAALGRANAALARPETAFRAVYETHQLHLIRVDAGDLKDVDGRASLSRDVDDA